MRQRDQPLKLRRKGRRPRGGPVVRALRDDLLSETAKIIDTATGEPHGARILKALAVLATGSEEDIALFFKQPLRLRARDRLQALALVEARRFGRVPTLDETPRAQKPVTIVNIYATSEEYDFVTAQRPAQVGSSHTPAALEAKREQP